MTQGEREERTLQAMLWAGKFAVGFAIGTAVGQVIVMILEALR